MQSEPFRTACSYCLSPGKLKTCSGCLAVAYCSTQCQRADWAEHKRSCRVDTKEARLLRKARKIITGDNFMSLLALRWAARKEKGMLACRFDTIEGNEIIDVYFVFSDWSWDKTSEIDVLIEVGPVEASYTPQPKDTIINDKRYLALKYRSNISTKEIKAFYHKMRLVNNAVKHFGNGATTVRLRV